MKRRKSSPSFPPRETLCPLTCPLREKETPFTLALASEIRPSEMVKERIGPVENVLTLNNGEEIIVRRQHRNGRTDGCHVVWPKMWMPLRPMGDGYTEWWGGYSVKEVKRIIEDRLEWMRGV